MSTFSFSRRKVRLVCKRVNMPIIAIIFFVATLVYQVTAIKGSFVGFGTSQEAHDPSLI